MGKESEEEEEEGTAEGRRNAKEKGLFKFTALMWLCVHVTERISECVRVCPYEGLERNWRVCDSRCSRLPQFQV